jgi:hypothetical protein
VSSLGLCRCDDEGADILLVVSIAVDQGQGERSSVPLSAQRFTATSFGAGQLPHSPFLTNSVL